MRCATKRKAKKMKTRPDFHRMDLVYGCLCRREGEFTDFENDIGFSDSTGPNHGVSVKTPVEPISGVLYAIGVVKLM